MRPSKVCRVCPSHPLPIRSSQATVKTLSMVMEGIQTKPVGLWSPTRLTFILLVLAAVVACCVWPDLPNKIVEAVKAASPPPGSRMAGDAMPPRVTLLAACCMAAAAAFVLAGYEFLRDADDDVVRHRLWRQEKLPAVTALIPFAIAGLDISRQARLLSWLGPRRTLFVTSLGAAVLIALGWAGRNAQGQQVGDLAAVLAPAKGTSYS